MLSILSIANKDEFVSEILNTLKDIFPGCTIKSTSDSNEISGVIERPELILISSLMDSSKVKALVKDLRSQKKTIHIPIVLLTDGHSDIPLSENEAELYIDGIITWPANRLSLKTMVMSMTRLGKSEFRLRGENSYPKQQSEKSIEDQHRFIERHKGIFEITGNAIAIYKAVENGNDFVCESLRLH